LTRILITGGAGYIGSHTTLELTRTGREVVVLDNLSNSSRRAVEAVRRLTNADIPFVEGDIRNRSDLDDVFVKYEIDAVIHFAGLKAVGESVREPLRYFDNNVSGTVSLVEAMRAARVKRLVFSSSATVYGAAATAPISETAPTGPTNPYGRTKLMIEQMLADLGASDPSFAISLLRYFNPVGAHPSGEMGEDPCGIPNNLLPYITQVAVGRLPELRVFGNDYDTHDGTGIRDYIHVLDLARGHLAALDFLDGHPGVHVHNLGTGRGYSVLDVVRAFERASDVKIPYRIVERRPGDIATSFADPSKAERELGWKARIGLDEMCADAWRWQSRHPHGFR
jgi:UDP-glucose 4-epimerase